MPLPEKYDVTVIVNVTGEKGTKLSMAMRGIKREDIMVPGYPEAIANVVKLLEKSVEWD